MYMYLVGRGLLNFSRGIKVENISSFLFYLGTSWNVLVRGVMSFQGVKFRLAVIGVFISGSWNSVYRGVLISGVGIVYTEVSSFQGVGIVYTEVS